VNLPPKTVSLAEWFTFYKWRVKYGGMEEPDARRLRELEAENNKLKKLLAEAPLDIHALNTAFGVKR